MSKETEKTPQELKLQAKVKELEKALEYEKMRTLALDTMINVAERDLKISIRKKSGTKQ
jgi:transposase